MTDLHRLERLLRARHECIWIPTMEEPYALQLVKDAALNAGMTLRVWSITHGVRDGIVESRTAEPNTEHPAAALYHVTHQLFHPLWCVMLDLAGHLEDERTMRVLRECLDEFRNAGSALILIDRADSMPAVVDAAATRFEPAMPDTREIEQLVRCELRELNQRDPIEVEISKTAYRTILKNLRGLTRGQVKRIITDVVADDRRFDDEDINHVLASKRQALHSGGLLEYIETPADLSEIGGLKRLKRWLKQRQNALSDKAQKFGLATPRGVLLLGVQGAGKSLCAKAIAAAWQRLLLRMDPGALYDRYIGESERRLRDTLRQAERMAPVVLWVDEIEKGFASAASRSTDGGLSQRMFGTLLTWMQDHRSPVFIVATANDIEALPPELLRKGRFDEIFFVDLPDGKTRREIFRIHLEKRDRDPRKFDLDVLAESSGGYSGAEIEQAIVAALHEAFAKHGKLDTEQITSVLAESPPLSRTMAEKIRALRQWAQGRCVPAN
ncbi:MAG: AAA family ATPase [Planctomycetota bacterium]|nr:AAA family ATPase [Planctomycetota bacterium]